MLTTRRKYVEQNKASTFHQQKGNMGRVVRNSSSRLKCNCVVAPYSYWNKPNTSGLGYWSTSMDCGCLHQQIHNRQDNVLNDGDIGGSKQ